MNSIISQNVNSIFPQTPPISVISNEGKPQSSRLKRVSISKCEHLWSYLGKIAVIFRNFLNAAARNCRILLMTDPSFPHDVKNITVHMKLLSIVGVPFSLLDIKSTSQKIFNSVLTRDKEGVMLGTLTFSIIAADILDSIATFVNSSLTIASKSTVGFFSAVGLPLGLGISSLGVVSRTIQIAKALNFYKQLNQQVFAEDKSINKEALRTFLEKKLGLEAEIEQIKSLDPDQIEKLKEKKKAELLRSVPKDAIKEMEDLLVLLNSEIDPTNPTEPLTEKKLEEILKSLEKIQSSIRKKVKIDVFGILANLIIISALTLLALGSVTPLPYLLIGSAFIIRLATLIYQDYKTKIN